MGLATFEEHAPLLVNFQFLPASATGLGAITGAAPLGQRIDAAQAVNSDTIDHVVRLWLTGGSSAAVVASALVPAGSGYGGVKAVDLFAAGFPAGFTGFVLPSGWGISASMEVAIQAGKIVTVTLFGGFF